MGVGLIGVGAHRAETSGIRCYSKEEQHRARCCSTRIANLGCRPQCAPEVASAACYSVVRIRSDAKQRANLAVDEGKRRRPSATRRAQPGLPDTGRTTASTRKLEPDATPPNPPSLRMWEFPTPQEQSLDPSSAPSLLTTDPPTSVISFINPLSSFSIIFQSTLFPVNAPPSLTSCPKLSL